MNIHAIWIGKELSLLEKLTIASLTKYGYSFNLWSYDSVDGVPEGVIKRDASEILPKESMYRFNGIPLYGIPNGGIGSLSHWSDRFAVGVLFKHGGVYTQMDVAYLKPLDDLKQYALIPHGYGNIGPYMIKAPANCKFLSETFDVLGSLNAQTIKDKDWDVSMRYMGNVARWNVPDYFNALLSPDEVMDCGCGSDGPFFSNVPLNSKLRLIHWSNATVGARKNNPISNSTYESLLKTHNLI